MKILTFSIMIFFSLKILIADDFTVNLAFEKAKSLVKKEEILAKAVKNYLLEKGTVGDISSYINEGYLPTGFSSVNDFGKQIEINTALDENQEKYLIINNQINLDTKSITKFYDYYYSMANRVYTVAPKNLSTSNVKINLPKLELFVLNNSNKTIFTLNGLDVNSLLNKYLIENGVLTWYDLSANKKYSYNGKDIIIYGDVDLVTTNSTIDQLLDDGFLSVGSLIYIINNGVVTQAMYLGEEIFKVLGNGEGNGGAYYTSATAKLLLTTYSGGYLLNGDIYTWGNNENNIVSIDKQNYKYGSTSKSSNVTISTPVRLKSKSYDSNISNENYFSSVNRVRYVDFFSSSENGTCGISNDYELYCTGYNGDDKNYLVSALQRDGDSEELLYKVSWFDSTKDEANDKFGKANKVVAIDKRWYVLANGTRDEHDSFLDADLYTWGEDSKGFAGNGEISNDDSKPVLIVDDNNVAIKMKDISISNEKLYKKVYALGTNGDIYTWGIDDKNATTNRCIDTVDGKSMDFCKPQNINSLINSQVKFVKLRTNSRGVIATSTASEEYYVYQKAGDLPKIVKIDNYISSNDTIISKDVIAKDSYSNNQVDVVWINDDNELKGDFNVLNLGYFGGRAIFENHIKSNKWLKVKFVDKQSMCAIDTKYQTYCWGRVGFDDNKYETISIPTLNTNNFSRIVIDGAEVDGWQLKNPTYINGFNYDFMFK